MQFAVAMIDRSEPDSRVMRTEILRKGGRYVPLVVMVLALPALLQLPAVREVLWHFAGSLRAAGLRGVFVYAAFYAAGCCIGLPLAVLSAVGGFAYGRFVGYPAAMFALTFGTTFSYVVVRLLLRRRIERWTASSERFARVQRMVRAEGLRVVVLLRWSVLLPQVWLAHVLAPTGLSAWRFALGTFVGMLPTTLLAVYIGSLVRDASGLANGGGRPPWPLVAAGVVVSVATMALLFRLARRELDAALARTL